MLKLIKYLKRSVLPIIVVVCLLAFQAICDLKLPDYTSDIVNVGIQQGGVENAVPKAIRESSLSYLEEFILPEDISVIEKNYTPLNQDSMSEKDYEKAIKKYPAIETETIYQLNDSVSDETMEELNRIFGEAYLTTVALNTESEQTAAIRNQVVAALPSEQQQTAESVPLSQLILSTPKSGREDLQRQINQGISEYGELVITQTATPMVLAEYQAIGMDTEAMQMNYLLVSGAKMLLVALMSVSAVILITLLASRVAAYLGQELRRRMFDKVLAFSGKELDKFSTASLITRTTNDIQQIQLIIVMLLRIVIYAPIIAIGGIIKVISTQVSLLWVIALAVFVLFSVVGTLFVVALPKFKVIQNLVDRLNLVMRETLTGLSVIRAFSTQEHERKRFDVANADLTRINIFVNRIMSVMMPAMFFIMNSTSVLVVWVGGHGVDAGTMQVGNMMAVIQYSTQIIMSFLMISMISIMLPRATVAANRIEEVLQTEISIKDPASPQQFDENKKGVVVFDRVSFKYPGAEENVLTDISFEAKSGETIAFIGSTGSGKSTLINLIPRFFDVTEGRILVDGVDVRDVTLHDLRSKIGYVPQKGILFSGTIEENIAYGKKELPFDMVEKAAEISQSTEFIEAKPEKYQSEISQGGTNVSGGQRQRLSIARAIATSPEIYIFDDSFSALDYKTDRALRAELKKEAAGSTTLIVAQRVSSIFHADKILVLNEGCLVGIGTHKELLENCQVYREIAQSQLSKEELENA